LEERVACSHGALGPVAIGAFEGIWGALAELVVGVVGRVGGDGGGVEVRLAEAPEDDALGRLGVLVAALGSGVVGIEHWHAAPPVRRGVGGWAGWGRA